jgi:hypothetical protein
MSNYFQDFEQQIELEKSSLLRTEHEVEIDAIHQRQLAEKDHEIERLQKRVLEFVDINIADRKLITELADVLDRPAGKTWQYKEHLVQRAREATK